MWNTWFSKKKCPNSTKNCLRQTGLGRSLQNAAVDVTRDNVEQSIIIWCFLVFFSSLAKNSQRKLGAFDENLK